MGRPQHPGVDGIALLLFLVASGRLHWLLAAVGSVVGAALTMGQRLLPLLRFAPLFQQLWARMRSSQAAGGGTGPQVSEVRTDYLDMRLDHATGTMRGQVRQGRFAGRWLADLDRAELEELLAECRRLDPESARLLEAYMERAGAEQQGAEQEPVDEDPAHGPMTASQAREILGVGPQADRDEIIQAHRRLMQRMHPDRGGSPYLAAQINRAKNLLLGKRA